MKNQSKMWIAGYFILVISALSLIAYETVKVDPFFHYHQPYTNIYFYTLNNQRSQNDGICKHFDYDALITGTSMVENFKTSEMDAIFGTNSIKVAYSGGTYKEINDNLCRAISNNPNLRVIVRGLDMAKFIEDKDTMRTDLGTYPIYLYDDYLLNDIEYVFNRDLVFRRVYPMLMENDVENFQAGITSFDIYSNWMAGYEFGIRTVCPNGISVSENINPIHLSDAEREIVLGTVRQNITSLAESYPEVTFNYFFTPYSIAWWGSLVNNGEIYKQIEAEQIVIEEILKCENIKLYSFNNLTNIITDLNNYKDLNHYASWVNSLILRYIKDDKCLLTNENYQDYLRSELSFYTTYDYSQLNNQIDYDNDYYAEALLNREISGIEPLDLMKSCMDAAELSRAYVVESQYDGKIGVQCRGRLQREEGSGGAISDYIANTDYVGLKISIDDVSNYKYLVFYGLKNRDCGQPSVYIYDKNNVVLAGFALDYHDLDNQWHQYIINISQLTGRVTIIFNGGYIDSTGDEDSVYTFSNMILY